MAVDINQKCGNPVAVDAVAADVADDVKLLLLLWLLLLLPQLTLNARTIYGWNFQFWLAAEFIKLLRSLHCLPSGHRLWHNLCVENEIMSEPCAATEASLPHSINSYYDLPFSFQSLVSRSGFSLTARPKGTA